MDKWTQQINRIISIALVISLLFAGMYVDIVPAEDLFVYDMTGKAAASLAPAQSDTNNDAICTAELPAVQNADLQSRTSYQQQYRETIAADAFPAIRSAIRLPGPDATRSPGHPATDPAKNR